MIESALTQAQSLTFPCWGVNSWIRLRLACLWGHSNDWCPSSSQWKHQPSLCSLLEQATLFSQVWLDVPPCWGLYQTSWFDTLLCTWWELNDLIARFLWLGLFWVELIWLETFLVHSQMRASIWSASWMNSLRVAGCCSTKLNASCTWVLSPSLNLCTSWVSRIGGSIHSANLTNSIAYLLMDQLPWMHLL